MDVNEHYYIYKGIFYKVPLLGSRFCEADTLRCLDRGFLGHRTNLITFANVRRLVDIIYIILTTLIQKPQNYSHHLP